MLIISRNILGNLSKILKKNMFFSKTSTFELNRFETKLKEEKQLRRKYPAVNQAYKDYQLTMKLVSSKTN